MLQILFPLCLHPEQQYGSWSRISVKMYPGPQAQHLLKKITMHGYNKLRPSEGHMHFDVIVLG